jgi:peptidoglycan/LPS O-acetylase OafA/YrhL
VRRGVEVPRIPAVDGFRAYAILGVVLIHVLLAAGVMDATEGTAINVVLWGVLGNVIDAFFIVSGFLLFLPVVTRAGEMRSLRSFARARAARLLPAYWLSLLVAAVLVSLLPPTPALEAPSPFSVGVHVLALQMPVQLTDLDVSLGFGINGPIWMISIIVGFYIVLPLIAGAYYRRPLLGLLLAAVLTVAWRELSTRADGLLERLVSPDVPLWAAELIASDQLPGWAFSFALGMTAASLYVLARRRFSPRTLERAAAVALLPILVVYCAFAAPYGVSASEVNAPFSGSYARAEVWQTLGSSLSRAALMAAIALGPLWIQRPFANRPIAKLAELSYGIYLIHFIVIVYLGRYATLADDGSLGALLVWCGFVVPLSVLYALGSKRTVEDPVLRHVRARERAERAAEVTPGSRPLVHTR